MNKLALRDRIIAQLQATLASQTAAAHLARDEAISEESRPESKYDTHSQEAAYLAEGQARLALEIQASVASFQTLSYAPLSPGAAIAVGALVEISTRGQSAWYFIGASAGGTEVNLDNKTVLVLTPSSPLGRQLIGRRAGESISSIQRGTQTKQTILQVL